MTERINFPKEHFTRTPDMDFSDDGTRFRMYSFHDTLPVSYTRADFGDGPEVFIDPRPDYLKNYEEIYEKCESAGIGFSEMNKFNGVKLEEFDMQEFVKLCTKIVEAIES